LLAQVIAGAIVRHIDAGRSDESTPSLAAMRVAA